MRRAAIALLACACGAEPVFLIHPFLDHPGAVLAAIEEDGARSYWATDPPHDTVIREELRGSSVRVVTAALEDRLDALALTPGRVTSAPLDRGQPIPTPVDARVAELVDGELGAWGAAPVGASFDDLRVIRSPCRRYRPGRSSLVPLASVTKLAVFGERALLVGRGESSAYELIAMSRDGDVERVATLVPPTAVATVGERVYVGGSRGGDYVIEAATGDLALTTLATGEGLLRDLEPAPEEGVDVLYLSVRGSEIRRYKRGASERVADWAGGEWTHIGAREIVEVRPMALRRTVGGVSRDEPIDGEVMGLRGVAHVRALERTFAGSTGGTLFEASAGRWKTVAQTVLLYQINDLFPAEERLFFGTFGGRVVEFVPDGEVLCEEEAWAASMIQEVTFVRRAPNGLFAVLQDKETRDYYLAYAELLL